MTAWILLNRIRSREARLGVIGLGYVGLPLAVEFARAGFAVVGYDVSAEKVADIQAGRSYIPDVSSDHLTEVVRNGQLVATATPEALRDVDIIDICVPTPLRKTRDPDLSYVVEAVNTVRGALRKGQIDHPGIDDVSGNHRRSRAACARGERAGGRAGFLSGVLARARRPGESDVQHPEHSEGGRRYQRREHRSRRGFLPDGDHHGGAGEFDASRRDGEAAREHVPCREHRPRQRAGADVASHEHRRLGSHRCGQDQAVRVHAVLPGARPRRPLYSDRSVLPVMEGAPERFRGAFHRARRERQRRHA